MAAARGAGMCSIGREAVEFSDFGAKCVPRLRSRWPNIIDTLLLRIKIWCHFVDFTDDGCADGAYCKEISGHGKPREKEYHERTNNIIGGNCRRRAGISG